ncbi:hypothetical protein D9V34_10990 [Mycetocola lacteus]|uniref:Uncharacterized protein n=1 Tax=Mycetocola lacteus TaxID=76637 RepID=A0A3L7APN4_9MICO|nr:hypothetical protein [Mycetocola lacteus]RLP82307.1 hypothetical protein D9V34_10990 [Mycetocola lacteus]
MMSIKQQRTADAALVHEAVRAVTGADATPAEVADLLDRVRARTAVSELSGVLARTAQAPHPALARGAQAGENAIRAIDTEFGLLTSAEVAKILGSSSTPSAIRALASDMRGRGELLALKRLNRFVYPGFQFDRGRGRVKPFVKPLVALTQASNWDEVDAVLWLCTPSTYFDDASRPVDHLDTEPERVMEIARRAWNPGW